MKRSKIFSLKGHVLLDLIVQNKLLLLLTLVNLLGIYLGCLFIDKEIPLAYDYAKSSFIEFFTLRSTDGSFFRILFSSLFASLIYAILIFLGGTSFVGILFSPTIVFLKATVFGMFSGYIYLTYGLKGIAFNALLLIPSNLFLFLGLLLAARESVAFSLTLAQLTMPKGYTVSMFSSFKKYCIHFLVILTAFLASAILDVFCSSVFIKFFNF